jgi:hypothetical protein
MGCSVLLGGRGKCAVGELLRRPGARFPFLFLFFPSHAVKPCLLPRQLSTRHPRDSGQAHYLTCAMIVATRYSRSRLITSPVP